MNQELSESRRMIIDSAQKIFSDHCDKKLLDEAECGIFPETLWQIIVENGFNQLGASGTETTPADLFAFIQLCGRYAVPAPIADTLLVNTWAGVNQQICGIGEIRNGNPQASSADNFTIEEVVWGRRVSLVAAVTRGSNQVILVQNPQLVESSTNMAGEPMDTLQGSNQQVVVVQADPYAQVALSRINLIAGSLQTLLDLGLQFATERSQFGRTISKFQAIQHSLAVVAAEVAASKRAADAAVDALGDPRFVFEVAASKARVGEAVGIVAEQVHQIHGAMGFTHEHRLHHFSRRCWAWRDSWGNEFYWQSLLGAHLASLGADHLWNFIATRS